MKSSMKFKIGIDFVMTVLLLCQMTYLLIGETAHEWMGVAMFILFILHHALNWRWYRNLVKGRYTGVRILQITVNFLVLISTLGLMVSGIILSREAFAFLPIQGGLGFARTLHMLSAYWGFIFMSSHLRPALGNDYGHSAEHGARNKSGFLSHLGAAVVSTCRLRVWHLCFLQTQYRRLSVFTQSLCVLRRGATAGAVFRRISVHHGTLGMPYLLCGQITSGMLP